MLPPAAATILHEAQELSSGGDNGGLLPPDIAGKLAHAGICPQRNGLLLRALGQEQDIGQAAGNFATKPSATARHPSAPGYAEPFRPIEGQSQGHVGPRNH
eukprot:1528759-Heterocapsa_arctica.AAC.1